MIGLGTLLARPHVPESLSLNTPISTGLSGYLATCFAGFEIGKLTHDAEMRAFFLSSGYSIAFMYVVMAMETIASIGLLIETFRRFAAAALCLIMLGAIATHYWNGDGWVDSLDAIRMAVLSFIIFAIGLRQEMRKPYE